MIRSANTGISGIIDYKGNVQSFTKWNEKKANIISKVYLNKEAFYVCVVSSIYIGRISTFYM